MNSITAGYRGVSLLMKLNFDRMIYLGALPLALAAGAWIGSLG